MNTLECVSGCADLDMLLDLEMLLLGAYLYMWNFWVKCRHSQE